MKKNVHAEFQYYAQFHVHIRFSAFASIFIEFGDRDCHDDDGYDCKCCYESDHDDAHDGDGDGHVHMYANVDS